MSKLTSVDVKRLREPQKPLTREELLQEFRESGEVNFIEFLDKYIEWVYPQEDTLQ